MCKTLASISPINFMRVFFLRLCGYTIGDKVYIGEKLVVVDELADKNNLIIGNRVSIAPGVILISSSGPNNSRLVKTVGTIHGQIIIEDDAWIGAGAIILPNIVIGECSIIGAGSVVTKNVTPFTKNAGIPSSCIGELIIE